MTKELKKLFITFSAAIFLLLLSFSAIAYFSLASSIQYQQRLESSQKIKEEQQEHFIATADGLKLSLKESQSDEEEPVIYFITNEKNMIKSSNYGSAIIDEVYQQIKPNTKVNHQHLSLNNKHFTVAANEVRTAHEVYWIYTIHDSTEAYHGLKQLRVTLISLILIYVLLIGLLAYLFARRAIRPYEESIERERQFIQDATHELKTPLAVMYSATDIIKLFDSDHLSHESTDALSDLRSEIQDMNLLVTDLTQLSRRPVLESVNLSAIAEDAARKLSIHSRIKKDIKVNGDEQSLKRMIYILVDNARKYNHDSVKIALSLSSTEQMAELTVRDNGAGVAEEDLPFIFDRFYRSSGQQHIKGSGIGLSLLKNIVEAHSGQYEAYNDDGFVVKIKLPKR